MIITDNDVKSINTVLLSLQDEIDSLKKQLASMGNKTESIQKLTNYNKSQTSSNGDDLEAERRARIAGDDNLAARVSLIDADASKILVDERGQSGYPYGVNVDRSYLVQLQEDKISRWGNRTSGLSEYGDNFVRSGDPKKPEQECNEVDGCQVWNGVHNAVAVGKGTIAGQSNTMVLGTFNVHDEDLKEGEERAYHALVVGNGTGTKEDERSNAFAVDQNGDIRVRGEIYYGCNPDSSGGKTIGDNIEAINQTISNLGDTYLPLSGGTMEDNAWIKFQENDDDTSGGIEIEKAKLYSSDGEFFIDSEGEIELKGTDIDINASTGLTLSGEGSVGIECGGDINMYPDGEVWISGNLTVTDYTYCNELEAGDGKFTGSLVIPTGMPSNIVDGSIWIEV